jgi:hypothetical protein
MKYAVWCRCEQFCPNFENDRVVKETDNPAEAILLAANVRDNDHTSWIVIKK